MIVIRDNIATALPSIHLYVAAHSTDFGGCSQFGCQSCTVGDGDHGTLGFGEG